VHIRNRNQKIPQFRSGVEAEHADIGDYQNQRTQQLRSAVETEHADTGNRNQRIPQFRSSVETEHAHIRNRNQRVVQVSCRNLACVHSGIGTEDRGYHRSGRL
jgi:hypothetical protein